MSTQGAVCRYSFYDHIACSHLDPLPEHDQELHRTQDGSLMVPFATSQLSPKALLVDIESANVWVRAPVPAGCVLALRRTRCCEVCMLSPRHKHSLCLSSCRRPQLVWQCRT